MLVASLITVSSNYCTAGTSTAALVEYKNLLEEVLIVCIHPCCPMECLNRGNTHSFKGWVYSTTCLPPLIKKIMMSWEAPTKRNRGSTPDCIMWLCRILTQLFFLEHTSQSFSSHSWNDTITEVVLHWYKYLHRKLTKMAYINRFQLHPQNG